MIWKPLCFALATLCLAPPLDEGQWLPQQLRAMDWDALRERGMRLTRDEFWHPEQGGVLSATVQINGCSASFCSPDGLVVTNHHCGFGAINALSTPETNYLRDGFAAKDRASELPAEGIVVYVVRRIENVTEQIQKAQAEAATDRERYQITEEIKRRLIREGEREPNTTCHIADFFEGREYHMYYRTKLEDVRLVYAPPRAIGEFGGEVDNWEWPRHTGDFAFFRAYAAPDGTPREYSPDNVPFRPEHHLRVSRDGVQEGDLAIIMGYPGRTERYESSIAVQDREGFFFPKRLDLLTGILDVLHAASEVDDAAELRYASTIKSLANVQKNAEGMVWGLARNAVVARKLAEEAEFEAWLAESSERQAEFGSVLADMQAIDLTARETQEVDLLLGLMLSPRTSAFFAGLVGMVSRAGQIRDGQVPDALRDAFGAAMVEDFETVQVPILGILLDELRRLPEGQRIAGSELLDVGHSGDDAELEPVDAMLTRLLSASQMDEAEGRLALLAGGSTAVQQSDDPLVVLARGALAAARERAVRTEQRAGRRIAVGTRWIDAQQQWRGTSFYPDANSTLRASIASVKGYEPRDGVYYTPHTTVAGILAKETGTEPFASPPALLDAAAKRHSSRYFDWRIGDVPVCFLTDGDTTGGNSGSPVINGRGELVGLNFDRVFENVSGDYGWNADRSRNISVDIRFVLWVVEQVLPAHHLLDELGVR